MNELKPQEVNAAIAYFEDAVRESDKIIADCSPALQAELTEQKQHFVVALEALRRTEPENKALTLEELKQMDGEPVYVKDFANPTRSGWKVLATIDVNIIFFTDIGTYDFNNYGKTWLAYFHRPEQEDTK